LFAGIGDHPDRADPDLAIDPNPLFTLVR
jgi:hypothetical protein